MTINKEEIRKAYTISIRRDVVKYGLVPYNMIPDRFISTFNKMKREEDYIPTKEEQEEALQERKIEVLE